VIDRVRHACSRNGPARRRRTCWPARSAEQCRLNALTPVVFQRHRFDPRHSGTADDLSLHSVAPFDEVSVATERQYSGVRSEQVFTIDGSIAVPADPVTLAAIGLRERDHLQAWVLAHPEILGDDLMIVTEEFDRWRTASGERDSDRLDVLAVDTDGRLVVAELKREKASDGVLNQVLNYGARVSRFSLDDLDEAYARYCAPATSPEEAAVQLREHAPTISDESLALGTRLVVLAAAYSDAVTNLALYLLGYGVPLTLLKFEVYRTDRGQLLLTTSQLLPVPDAEEFMVRPRSGVVTRNAAQVDRRAQRRLAVLLKRLDDGQRLTVIAPPGVRRLMSAPSRRGFRTMFTGAKRCGTQTTIRSTQSSGFTPVSVTPSKVWHRQWCMRLPARPMPVFGATTGLDTTATGTISPGTPAPAVSPRPTREAMTTTSRWRDAHRARNCIVRDGDERRVRERRLRASAQTDSVGTALNFAGSALLSGGPGEVVEPEGFGEVVVIGRQRYSPDPAQLQGYLRVRTSLENGPEREAIAVARLELHTVDEVTRAVMQVVQPGRDALSERSRRGQAQRTGVQIGQAVPECG